MAMEQTLNKHKQYRKRRYKDLVARAQQSERLLVLCFGSPNEPYHSRQYVYICECVLISRCLQKGFVVTKNEIGAKCFHLFIDMTVLSTWEKH